MQQMSTRCLMRSSFRCPRLVVDDIKSSDDETCGGGSSEVVMTSMHCINPCVT